MKEDQKIWWRTFAPYWELLENRHLGVYQTQKIIDSVVEPVLVVGAGQGLVVDYLKNLGLKVFGVDLEKEMVLGAKKRRSLSLLRADAAALPFASRSFNTVLVATGVVDYIDSNEAIAKILFECSRVLSHGGALIVSFFRITPKIEGIYRKIGVLTEANEYRPARIFELFRLLDIDPLLCVRCVKKWTGRSYLSAFFYWTWLGLTLPRDMKNEQATIEEIVEKAKLDGVTKDELFKAAPESIPYRGKSEIENIMKASKFDGFEIIESDDCITVKCIVSNLNAD